MVRNIAADNFSILAFQRVSLLEIPGLTGLVQLSLHHPDTSCIFLFVQSNIGSILLLV